CKETLSSMITRVHYARLSVISSIEMQINILTEVGKGSRMIGHLLLLEEKGELRHQFNMKKVARRFLIVLGYLRVAQCIFFGKHIYIDEKKTWPEAREYCRKLYTDLSSIDSEEENKAFTIFSNEYSLPQIWIGLYKDANDTWKWSGGTNASYFNRVDQNNTEDGNCVVKTAKGCYAWVFSNIFHWVSSLILCARR
uniref:C-type lectin domain-containing protein n=1 Tax=Salarias fasciatus TaxID=181472 RepID=A0A672GB63_SALFA